MSINRFRRGKIVSVGKLPRTFIAALFINGFLAALSLGMLYFTYSYYQGRVTAQELAIAKLTPLPSPVIEPTWTPAPTYTPYPTPDPSKTPLPTFTPLPTWTPPPTFTPFPTWTPPPTITPIPTPTRVLYSYNQLKSMPPELVPERLKVYSEFTFAFYRAICFSEIPNYKFIQPRVITTHDLDDPGYYFRLDNSLSGYDYVSDLPWTSDTTFYLSDNSSVFSVQLFYYSDPVSDRVAVQFPTDCLNAQIIYVESTTNYFDIDVIQSNSIEITDLISSSVVSP